MAESELLLQQEALQVEASEVADELRLYELLSQAGEQANRCVSAVQPSD